MVHTQNGTRSHPAPRSNTSAAKRTIALCFFIVYLHNTDVPVKAAEPLAALTPKFAPTRTSSHKISGSPELHPHPDGLIHARLQRTHLTAMGYPEPLNPTFKRLNPGVFIASTAFSILDRLRFGNRMAVLTIPNTNKLLIWSSLPICDGFDEAMKQVSKGQNFEVAAAVVPNIEHAMAANDLKKKYPDMVLIGPPKIHSKIPVALDYEFKYEDGDKIINGSAISPSLSNYDFLFLKGHKNNELILLDKENKTLFQSDLIMNIPYDGINDEQYPGQNQNKGFFGYLSMHTNPDSWFGRYLFANRLFKRSPENCAAMKTLMSMDFDTMVLSHGNNIEKDAKSAILKVFGEYLK